MSASAPVPELHELEREIMEEVWKRGEASVRTVLDALNARSARPRAYTTVMTVLLRLSEKRMLDRRLEGRGYVYVPALSREQYFDARAREQVGALVDEFGEVALVHFARRMEALDPQRRQRLRRLARRD